MADLRIRVEDANRQPVPGLMRITVADGTRLALDQREATSDVLVTGLYDHRPYTVRAYPDRRRPVGQVVVTNPGENEARLFAPLDPQSAVVTFPSEPPADIALPRQAYDALTAEERAGLLNVYAKMSALGLWMWVQSVKVVRRDRIFATVSGTILAALGADYQRVSGALHESPLPAYATCIGSWKTRDRYGNLQVTLFRNDDGEYLVDADLDDANGFEHVFQVLRNHLTRSTTHPYDIHELLVFGRVPPPYHLT